MTISNEQLKTYGEEYGFSLTDRMVEQFGTYADTLLEWNQKMNLPSPSRMILSSNISSTA